MIGTLFVLPPPLVGLPFHRGQISTQKLKRYTSVRIPGQGLRCCTILTTGCVTYLKFIDVVCCQTKGVFLLQGKFTVKSSVTMTLSQGGLRQASCINVCLTEKKPHNLTTLRNDKTWYFNSCACPF